MQRIPETWGLLCDLKLAEHPEEGVHFLYFAPYPLLFCKELSVFFFQCLAPHLLEGVSPYTQIGASQAAMGSSLTRLTERVVCIQRFPKQKGVLHRGSDCLSKDLGSCWLAACFPWCGLRRWSLQFWAPLSGVMPFCSSGLSSPHHTVPEMRGGLFWEPLHTSECSYLP